MKNIFEQFEQMLLNNSNIGCNCRNNVDICMFEPIFVEINKLRYVKEYQNFFNPRISQFVNLDLLREEIELEYGEKLANNDLVKESKTAFLEASSQRILRY